MGPCAALGVNTQLICILFAYLHNEPNWLQMNRCASLPGCALPGLAAVGFAVGCCSGGTQQHFGCLLPDPFSALVAAPLLIPSLQFLSILLFLTLPSSAPCPAQQGPVGAMCGAHKETKIPRI